MLFFGPFVTDHQVADLVFIENDGVENCYKVNVTVSGRVKHSFVVEYFTNPIYS